MRYGARIPATFSMMMKAASLGIASPLGNSRLELRVISIHCSVPRTCSWSLAIRSPNAARTLSAICSSGSPSAAPFWTSRSCSFCVVRGRSSPMGIAFIACSGWLNTPVRVSERILYLPSLIDEMEYMTTKKANNRVMKSA
ncbi:hypothetical protein D9M70_538430 [compost metagenome]